MSTFWMLLIVYVLVGVTVMSAVYMANLSNYGAARPQTPAQRLHDLFLMNWMYGVFWPLLVFSVIFELIILLRALYDFVADKVYTWYVKVRNRANGY